jgi:hypothetical protein
MQTAPYCAAEVEVSASRGVERDCTTSALGSAACPADYSAVFHGSLTYGLSIPMSRFRPYVQGGFGGMVSTDSRVGGYGVASAGLSTFLTANWAARLELGRRFDTSGGVWHFLAGVAFTVTGG